MRDGKSGGSRRMAAAAAACLLLLTACGASAETPEAPEDWPPEPISASPLPGLDLPGLEASMPPEEYEALAAFLPVLEGTAAFRWTAGPYRGDPEGDWEPRDVTLADFHDALWEGADGPARTDALELDSLTVADVIQSGSRDLVLLVRDLGYNYLVLHREGDDVFGTDLPVRWFESLQENGVYIGSGGAGDQTYSHMSFQDGRFVGQELAHAAGGSREIGGLPVAQEEFDTWEFETMVGDVTWYAPAP